MMDGCSDDSSIHPTVSNMTGPQSFRRRFLNFSHPFSPQLPVAPDETETHPDKMGETAWRNECDWISGEEGNRPPSLTPPPLINNSWPSWKLQICRRCTSDPVWVCLVFEFLTVEICGSGADVLLSTKWNQGLEGVEQKPLHRNCSNCIWMS